MTIISESQIAETTFCMYTKSVDITFDSQKDLNNQAERGISLSEAANLDWDSWLGAEDVRRDYGEVRYRGYAIMPAENRLYCVVHTYREDAIRIISLRKANSREVVLYEATKQTT